MTLHESFTAIIITSQLIEIFTLFLTQDFWNRKCYETRGSWK